MSWNITGETRPYKAAGAYFSAVSPARPVGQGGPGAWELVLRYSDVDLDAGTLRGGRFRRITPMVNWHLSDFMRLEFAYGVRQARPLRPDRHEPLFHRAPPAHAVVVA